jgi:hypothetical protein
MKTATAITLIFSAFLLMTGCRKNDNAAADGQMTAASDSVAADSRSADTSGSGNTSAGSASHATHRRHKLTQHEIDSLKAERDKIVTPPANSGASLTPGSGPATPDNTKTYGGKTSTMDGEK